MAFFWPKNQTFEIKNYRGVTEEWCKIRRKTELRFGKWHEEFGNFSPGHSKVSNLGLWWDPFFQSRKCMSLKFTEELYVLTMKKDIKFEEESTSPFQNWQILIRPLESLKNCTLMGSFLPKYIMLELKRYRGVMFGGTEDWLKIWRKLTCALRMDMRNLAKFHRLKNSNFILKSKMAELNQKKKKKKKIKTSGSTRKLYFTLEIN